MTEPFNYHRYGINDEPQHNTDSVFCWCAPRVVGDGSVVVHKDMQEILEGADELSSVLDKLYSSETNIEISCFWDSGWTVKLGDHVNGYTAIMHIQEAKDLAPAIKAFMQLALGTESK